MVPFFFFTRSRSVQARRKRVDLRRIAQEGTKSVLKLDFGPTVLHEKKEKRDLCKAQDEVGEVKKTDHPRMGCKVSLSRHRLLLQKSHKRRQEDGDNKKLSSFGGDDEDEEHTQKSVLPLPSDKRGANDTDGSVFSCNSMGVAGKKMGGVRARAKKRPRVTELATST